MAGSQQYTTGTGNTTLVASCPAAPDVDGPLGWFYLANTDATNAVYLGGPGVSSANGVKVAAGGNLSGFLFGGDQIFVIAAAGTPVVAVLVTGL